MAHRTNRQLEMLVQQLEEQLATAQGERDTAREALRTTREGLEEKSRDLRLEQLAHSKTKEALERVTAAHQKVAAARDHLASILRGTVAAVTESLGSGPRR